MADLSQEEPRALRNFLYWPAGREYSIPWLCGPAIFFVLSAFGAAGGKAPSLGSVPSSFGILLLLGALLLAFNAMLLWAHLRSQYLTWGVARDPFLGTLAVLVASYLLIWGVILLARGEARLALDRTFDPLLTLRCLDLGLTGLVPALLLSALLKSEEPGVTNLRLERENARSLLRELLNGTLENGQHRALSRALDQIQSSAESLLGRLRTPRELLLLESWTDAAADLAGQVRGLGYLDLMEESRGRLRERLAAALAKLDADGRREWNP